MFQPSFCCRAVRYADSVYTHVHICIHMYTVNVIRKCVRFFTCEFVNTVDAERFLYQLTYHMLHIEALDWLFLEKIAAPERPHNLQAE